MVIGSLITILFTLFGFDIFFNMTGFLKFHMQQLLFLSVLIILNVTEYKNHVEWEITLVCNK